MKLTNTKDKQKYNKWRTKRRKELRKEKKILNNSEKERANLIQKEKVQFLREYEEDKQKKISDKKPKKIKKLEYKIKLLKELITLRESRGEELAGPLKEEKKEVDIGLQKLINIRRSWDRYVIPNYTPYIIDRIQDYIIPVEELKPPFRPAAKWRKFAMNN